MAEPEDVLLDGAHHATLFVQSLWRRRRAGAPPATVALADVRRRLDLLVHAAFGADVAIAPADPPPPATWFRRFGQGTPRHLVARAPVASTDGKLVRLPRALPADGGAERYRLTAAVLTALAARGAPAARPSDPLESALFLAREAAAAEALVVRRLPGLADALARARADALAARPSVRVLTPPEIAVEAVVEAALAGRLDAAGGPDDTAAWAREQADAIRAGGGRYRGTLPVAHWGVLTAPPPEIAARAGSASDEAAPPARAGSLVRRPDIRAGDDDEDDGAVGLWMVQLDDPQEHVEDPMGLQRPTDRDDDADPDGLADSLSELPEARLVSAPGSPREVLAPDDAPPLPRAAHAPSAPASAGTRFVYPEWDYRVGGYTLPGATVVESPGEDGDAAWGEAVRRERAALLALVRRRFERLRARRQRVGRQPDGPDLDVAAVVEAHADLRAGYTGDGRLYQTVRPERRDVAVALLADVSGSTDSWVSGTRRVIDVEREALVVVAHALDALGDPFAIYAFSGEGPSRVDVRVVKGFAERAGLAVDRRIAALHPERYTRMGAACRHATARLMRQPARHRLLLVLSDGKPNDVDRYEGRYGVEDTRQAVAEARLQGLHPFCLTVDREAPAYLPRIFGPGHFAVLHAAERLPAVLVDVLRRLVVG